MSKALVLAAANWNPEMIRGCFVLHCMSGLLQKSLVFESHVFSYSIHLSVCLWALCDLWYYIIWPSLTYGWMLWVWIWVWVCTSSIYCHARRINKKHRLLKQSLVCVRLLPHFSHTNKTGSSLLDKEKIYKIVCIQIGPKYA